MYLHYLDILVLLAYLVGMALMGIYFSRNNNSTEDYFVGSRSFQGWVIGLSLVGTSISSITFLAYPADAFNDRMATIYPQPFFRYGKITSAYEYLEHRFGLPVRVYGSISFIAGQLVRVSIILYLISLVLYEITGLSSEICILIGGTFVAFYTVTGGIRAVIWTDVVQTIILVLGGVACLSIIIIKLPDGLSQIFRIASASNKISFSKLVDGKLHPISWGISLTSKTGTMMLILGLTAWLTEYSGNQNVIQRYCTSKNIICHSL